MLRLLLFGGSFSKKSIHKFEQAISQAEFEGVKGAEEPVGVAIQLGQMSVGMGEVVVEPLHFQEGTGPGQKLNLAVGLGQKVVRPGLNTLDLTGLPNGMYCVYVQSDAFSAQRKIIKQD